MCFICWKGQSADPFVVPTQFIKHSRSFETNKGHQNSKAFAILPKQGGTATKDNWTPLLNPSSKTTNDCCLLNGSNYFAAFVESPLVIQKYLSMNVRL